jgi:hypothetical protein
VRTVTPIPSRSSVKDWWGAELPVARGQNNFDTVRFEYYCGV